MSQMKAQVDKLLTNASGKFQPRGMVCEQILPFIGVKQKSGLFGKHGKGHLRIVNSLAGGRGKYPQIDVRSYETQQYLIEAHGLEGLVSADDYANVEEPFDAEKDESNALTTMLWLGKEKSLADTLTSTAIITQNTTLVGPSQFSDYANSDPHSVIMAGKKAVRDGCGVAADTMVLDYDVAEMLRFHPAILDRLGYKEARPGGLSDEELARAFKIARVIIAEAKYNSSKQGQADVLSNVWGKHIVLGVCPTSAAKEQISLGYRLGYIGKSPRQVYKWDIKNPPGSQAILVEDHYDFLMTDAGAAYLIKDAIA